MTKSHGASNLTNNVRRARRSAWRAGLIVAPLLAASLAANALFGMAMAPQIAGILSHAAPVNHTALAVMPADGILGGPGIP